MCEGVAVEGDLEVVIKGVADPANLRAEFARDLFGDLGASRRVRGEIREPERGDELARPMVQIGAARGVPTVALMTAMDRPLGRAVGNALETREAMECLAGGGPTELAEVTVALVGEMLALGGLAKDGQDAVLPPRRPRRMGRESPSRSAARGLRRRSRWASLTASNAPPPETSANDRATA